MNLMLFIYGIFCVLITTCTFLGFFLFLVCHVFKAREDLESRLLKEAALREVEKRRLREVEEAKKELQRLLEEERQAKRDEEIVRQLQAR